MDIMIPPWDPIGAYLTPRDKGMLNRSLTGKPAPEVVRVLGPMPVWL